MPRRKTRKVAAQSNGRRTKFINVAVSNETLAGLHLLKSAMEAPGQADVIERLVNIGIALHLTRH